MKNTFELEHVGINTDNAGEAEQLALLLCKRGEPRRPEGCDGGAGGKWLPLPHGDCRLF